MKNIKEKIKAVIFDMDGTIIQSEHVWDFAVSQTLKDQNIQISLEEAQELSKQLGGMGLETSLSYLKERFNLSKQVHELSATTKLHAANQFYKGVEFISGFEDFHNELSQNQIPSCIATNCDDETLEKIKNIKNLPRFFGQHIYNLSNVNNKPKPDPAMFLHAAKKLNVSANECVVFEDSMHGFKAAKAAGMKCIAIKNKTNLDLLHYVDEAIEDYSMASKILNKILNKN